MPTLLDLYKLIQEDTLPKYIIYCDLDGVLVGFDEGYHALTGKTTNHSDVQNKKEFWSTFNRSLKDKNTSEFKYWAELSWNPGGKQLWDYIKKYTPFILTAPTYNPESKEGKRVWVANNLDNVKKVYFAYSAFKPEYSRKNRILIDDRKDTIDAWIARGGIGIHHTSAPDTIKQLKQLGL
jgi:hypothetical protein